MTLLCVPLAHAYFAVGLSCGMVSMRSAWVAEGNEPLKEFCPRVLRPPTDLSWRDNLLAVGYERVKGEPGILIFDSDHEQAVFGATHAQPTASRLFSSNKEEKVLAVRAYRELAVGEVCNSLDFFAQGSPRLVAGLGSKSLRLLDVRAPDRNDKQGPQVAASSADPSVATRGVHGVRVDPTMDERIASFYENTVMLWDTRMFDRPLATLAQRRRITALQWNPQRSGQLCSAVANSPHLTIYDVQSWTHKGIETPSY
jgi:hypothetical protein